MKTPKLHFLVLAIVLMSFNHAGPGLTDAERKYASDLLKETKENLLKKVKDLSGEQLSFKADPASWSIVECVEHLTISENNFLGYVQMGLKETADPAKRSELKMPDDAIVKLITDRTNKVKTQEAFEPAGKYGSFDLTLQEFITKRDTNINYINTTSDDLRNHYNDFPFGKIDTYQTFLFMAGHTKRHTIQIDEIMANPKFPKK